MKKRNILLSMLLVFTMMLAACGSGNPLEGKWTGTLDVTKQFNDGIIEYYPELTEYTDFEELVFVIDVEFADGQMSMEVQQESIDAFNTNFEAGMTKIAEGALLVNLTNMGLTMEEAVAESGMTEDEYRAYMLEQMEIDEMEEAMRTVTNDSMTAISAINGPYTYNENDVNLRYEDNYYEAIEYAFEGDNLILTFKGDGYSLRIVCEAQ